MCVLLWSKKIQTIIKNDFYIFFVGYITNGRIELCIILDRHMVIKKSMTCHRYYSRYFISNFNTRLRKCCLEEYVA
jgi:hypothetical protein